MTAIVIANILDLIRQLWCPCRGFESILLCRAITNEWAYVAIYMCHFIKRLHSTNYRIVPFIFIFMKEVLVKVNIYWVRNISVDVIAAVYNQNKWTSVYLQRGINHSQMKLDVNDTTLYHRYKMFCYMVWWLWFTNFESNCLEYIVLLMFYW